MRWMAAAVLFVAAMSLASSSAAQDITRPAPLEERVSLRLPLAIYAGSAAADLYTTHRALQRDGFYERNPMGAWLDERPTTLVVFSAAADAAIVWGLHRSLARRHSRLVRAGLYAAAGVRLYFSARNASATRAYDRRAAGRN